ncbi:Tyrosine recombinase XerC [Aquicella siphonis]|uniref:Tyrosine recombinase XerC n=1 Tax=Aquicella siphonis TaxID=254247 RepID=A0A5E4PG34_9COXI|nr:site-specific integrase [Aquicella siphonis]VVC75970.1 Tyrosine recombinase XerC [Aquicella siphonis]
MARQNRGQAKVLTKDEFKRLIKIVSARKYAKRDYLILLFSFGLGLRSIEIANLKVKDVLDDNLNVHEVVELQRTKGNTPRAMYLTDERIRAAIKDYIDWRIDRALKKREVFSRNQPFFVSQKGGGFSNITLTMLFDKIYKEAGIKASSHSGRRTFATNLVEEGIDVKSLQLLMGHSNVQQTLKYVDGNPERLKKLVMNALY